MRVRSSLLSVLVAMGSTLSAWPAHGDEPPKTAPSPTPAPMSASQPSEPGALPALPVPTTPSTDPMPSLLPDANATSKEPEATKKAPAADKSSNEEKDKGTTSPYVKPTVHFLLDGGYDWHSYASIPFRGFQLDAAAEAEFTHFGVYGALGVTISSSSADLGLVKVGVMFGGEYIYERFRVGMELSTAYLNIQRVTTPGDNFEVATYGVAGQMSFDVLRFDPRGAIYLRAKIMGDVYSGGDTGIGTAWGPTFLVGFRY